MPEITLAWKRRTLVCTGPGTYSVAIPIVGTTAPDPWAVYDLVAELQQLCLCAAPPIGTRLRAIRGRVTTLPGSGHHLLMYVTVERGSGDPHRDGAYVATVLRSAARRATAQNPSAAAADGLAVPRGGKRRRLDDRPWA